MFATLPMTGHPEPAFSSSVFDAFNCGLFQFVDGRLSMINKTGRELLKDGFLTISEDRVQCRQPTINRRLQSYLGQTAKTQDTPLVLCDPVTKAEYCIRLHRQEMAPGTKCRDLLLSVTQLRQVKPPTLSEVRVYADSYGLSEAEIVVLHAVLGNTELRSLAKIRRVHPDTVRKQLKSAMAKIDVRSQKELFALYERFRFSSL